ncbi:probable LRR receptor-like serine/threonine-protein kinase At3g47570 [Camellia sinensis]|uniref:probable LRR receptor-like serine/threonine-protein kinase At3g47570 n=1 Tax=Camellia sinensis TaxID=4442 RepID=UPI0010363887|nr:probable LRR receptor-like serine/threonine-protein kinase At3g47570 [Camellia sinensis]
MTMKFLSHTSSLQIKGTVGYAAPEYGMGSDLSTYSDVYSYGILLLEMFTGKIPTDDMFKDGQNLHKLAEMASPEQVMEIVDQVLLFKVEDEEATSSNSRTQAKMEVIQKCLIFYLKSRFPLTH